MTLHTVMPVQNGDTLGTIRQLLKRVLEENLVNALLVPVETPNAERVTPILVKDSMQFNAANPLAPIMTTNAAIVLARFQRETSGKFLGAVLRPCELRTVVELAKVGRINRSRLLLIGIDCLGTYEPEAYTQLARASHRSPTDESLRWARQGPIAPYRLRNACQICEHFVPENADISIGLLGMNIRDRILVHARADIEDKLYLNKEPLNSREKALARLATIRHHRYEQAVANATQMLGDLSSLLALFAHCDGCGECNEACPFCGTAAFRPFPKSESRAQRAHAWASGSMWRTLPSEMGPFSDLVAWGRRAASCVGCGMCESSCAQHTPLTAIQAALGRKLREQHHYVPGRDINEKLPWAVA
ncbi:MAG: Coenzyme F420 hydrogenase/dehydrogenase, beta subunit C-terminal domain [Chloroflexi bacterium]|nr:Coenzyme F420 hydrogenase/dehydrogenase, beta subunit C-terminal domain [Chloroflexota bacterium]